MEIEPTGFRNQTEGGNFINESHVHSRRKGRWRLPSHSAGRGAGAESSPTVKGRRTAGVEFTLRPNRHSVSVSKEDKGTQKH